MLVSKKDTAKNVLKNTFSILLVALLLTLGTSCSDEDMMPQGVSEDRRQYMKVTINDERFEAKEVVGLRSTIIGITGFEELTSEPTTNISILLGRLGSEGNPIEEKTYSWVGADGLLFLYNLDGETATDIPINGGLTITNIEAHDEYMWIEGTFECDLYPISEAPNFENLSYELTNGSFGAEIRE